MFFFPFGIIVLALMIWSLFWVYEDADERGKNPILVTVLVFLVNWPLSLLLWYVFRPETPEQSDPATNGSES